MNDLRSTILKLLSNAMSWSIRSRFCSKLA
jgi:hypothetical protein